MRTSDRDHDHADDHDRAVVGRRGVADALAVVVDDFGVEVARSPERLRAALSDALGSRGREQRAAIDALVLAADVGVSSDTKAVDAETPASRLTDRGLGGELSRWSVEAWRQAISEPAGAQATVRRADLVEATDVLDGPDLIEATIRRSAATGEALEGPHGPPGDKVTGSREPPDALRWQDESEPLVAAGGLPVRPSSRWHGSSQSVRKELMVAVQVVAVLVILGSVLVASGR